MAFRADIPKEKKKSHKTSKRNKSRGDKDAKQNKTLKRDDPEWQRKLEEHKARKARRTARNQGAGTWTGVPETRLKKGTQAQSRVSLLASSSQLCCFSLLRDSRSWQGYGSVRGRGSLPRLSVLVMLKSNDICPSPKPVTDLLSPLDPPR